MILLDTNVLSELMKTSPHPDVLAWMDAQLITNVFISSVTRAEIELGIALLPDGRRKRAIADAAQIMFGRFSERSLVFGDMAATKYGSIVAYRRRLGRPVPVQDAQIAAIALTHGLHLATRNVKDFEHISGLEIVNPWT